MSLDVLIGFCVQYVPMGFEEYKSEVMPHIQPDHVFDCELSIWALWFRGVSPEDAVELLRVKEN